MASSTFVPRISAISGTATSPAVEQLEKSRNGVLAVVIDRVPRGKLIIVTG